MKTPLIPTPAPVLPVHRRITSLTALTVAVLIPGIPAFADNLYWGGAAASPWTTPENWFTDATGETASSAAPTISDNLFFNTTANTANGQVSIASNVAAASLTFNSPGTMRLSQTTNSNRVLTLGASGITLNSGAGAVQLGESSGSLSVQTTASQTWTNNSTAGLTVRSPSVSNTATCNVTLTLNASSTGAIK
ncbi:MAG: hypothetical protein ABW223_06965 [Rariglobus sp.]